MRLIEIPTIAVLSAVLTAGGTALAADAPPAAEPAVVQRAITFTPDQLDQMVSPIALYPDALLARVLMAATYPLELVQADRWMKKHPGLKGDELDKALENEAWDPSVRSLTHFPDVLGRMAQELDWTQDLGDAFLGQQKGVMEAVQRMRAKAYAAGNLKSTQEQTVNVEEQGGRQTIIIQQADPQIIYVPAYNPTVVYGSAWAPPAYYYPAVMTYPPGYVATTSLLSFGVGMAVGAAVWGGCDWGHDHVTVNNYNINQINKANIGNKAGNTQEWRHNPQHRRGVPYQEASARERYGDKGGVRGAGTLDSAAARGFERPAGAQQRPATGRRPATGGAQRPGGGSAGRQGGGGRGDAFGGYGNGRATREASARGAASRGGGGLGGSSGGGGGGRRR